MFCTLVVVETETIENGTSGSPFGSLGGRVDIINIPQCEDIPNTLVQLTWCFLQMTEGHSDGDHIKSDFAGTAEGFEQVIVILLLSAGWVVDC